MAFYHSSAGGGVDSDAARVAGASAALPGTASSSAASASALFVQKATQPDIVRASQKVRS